MKRSTALSLLIGGCFLCACGDDEPDAPAGATTSTTGSPTSSTAAGVGGNGSGGNGSGGNTSSSSTGSGGSIMTTPCNGTTCDLTFEGTGFNEADGLTLHWGIQLIGDTSGDLVYQDSVMIAGGTFSSSAPGILEKSASYNLNYFVDHDGNGICESNVQPVWRVQLASVMEHYHVIATYDLTETTNLGCSGFGPP